MTRDDIKVSRGQDCLRIEVSGKVVYGITISDDVPIHTGIDMLMDQVCHKELGITSHDITMVVADFIIVERQG